MAQLNSLQLQNYVTNALDCVEFKLIRRREEIEENSTTSFHPEYAHQIFGENESIFGYKDLRVRLFYTAGPLNIYLGMKYTGKVEDVSKDGMKADDVIGKITKLLATGCFYTNIDEFLSKLAKEESFQPFGEKIHSWTIESDKNEVRTFEIYECNRNTSGFLAYHARLQTFLLWFVDAASYIDIDDPQWQFFVCYEKYTTSDGKTMYASVGYTTVYLYYAYPQHNRPRISQMLVLPPFQGMGIGAKLVEEVYNRFNKDSVIDITVEDPSDDFRRVRNFVDAKLCRTLPAFAPEKLLSGYTKDMAKAAKDAFKINPRQSRIVYEILRLGATNIISETDYKSYRLSVKKRLNIPYHKQCADFQRMEKSGVDIQMALASLPTKEERMEQLKEEYQAHEDEYRRILHRLEITQ